MFEQALCKMSGADLATWVVQHGAVSARTIGPVSVWEVFGKSDRLAEI